MLTRFFRRIQAAIDHFIRAHIVADEKDLWPDFTPLELQELETAQRRLDAGRP